ncbi:MAG: DUF151 domain-containing protein [Muribaculaceae bacterium]
MERIKLKVYGITYSQVQSGAYALVLSQVDGAYRIPIVIGVSEAQSIAVKLENITPSRPMSHDLFVSLLLAFGIRLEEVFIYSFKDGVFSAELKFNSQDREVTIDARTSDAIALSLRTDAPIYTTQEIIEETGFKFTDSIQEHHENDANQSPRTIKLENFSIAELEKMMLHYAEKEEYERAAEIKSVLNNKRQEKNKRN